jgi:Ca-activated chloride channel homolog
MTMMNRILLLLIIAKFFATPLHAQHENANLRRGNSEYRSENYQDAELNYRKALENNPSSVRALYNLANSLYRQGRYDEAANILEGISQAPMSDERRADVYHNLGNAKVNANAVKDAIEAYKNSLRIRPADVDTRHNLAKAMKLLQEQEQQQQQQQDDQQQEKQEQEQDQNQDQQQKPEQQQEKQRPDQISPQDAQRILDAMNQQEQRVQEKIDRDQRQRQPLRPEKEW